MAAARPKKGRVLRLGLRRYLPFVRHRVDSRGTLQCRWETLTWPMRPSEAAAPPDSAFGRCPLPRDTASLGYCRVSRMNQPITLH